MLALPANWRLSLPTVFYDPRALPQSNRCVWPALARSPIGRPRNNEGLKAGEELNDVLAVISPDVDPVDKVSSGSGLVVSQRNGSWLICGCVDCARDNLSNSAFNVGAVGSLTRSSAARLHGRPRRRRSRGARRRALVTSERGSRGIRARDA
jgi:hypothetical protein